MNAPSWMKPHLRQRLEQERADKERTGPVNGEKALVADDKGRIKEVVTDHKPQNPPKLPPKNSFSPLEFGTDDDAPELGQEFFDKAIVTKPGESLVDKARGCGHFFDKMFEQLYGPFTHRFSTRMGWEGKPETWVYTYDNKNNLVAKRRAW